MGCAMQLEASSLVCPRCHTLVHAEKLNRLSAAAKFSEEHNDLIRARTLWQDCLPLLPPTTEQALWIRKHLEIFQPEGTESQPKTKWISKLGPLAPIAVVLVKAKSLIALLKLQFLLSLVSFVGIYWALFGARFGIGFAALILVHEMGHFIDIKRRRLPADMPVFLPGLGAYVRWQALGVPIETRAAVSLAGPFAGLLASVACLGMWWSGGGQVWAALAHTSAWLNILNLTPVSILDGGQAAFALGRIERIVLLTASLLLWGFLGEGLFVIVAAGAAYRLFTKDLPAKPSPFTSAYFLFVLVALALVLAALPKSG